MSRIGIKPISVPAGVEVTVVRENIRQGNTDATDEQIIEVTKKSGCYEFIMQLENGFDTVVGLSLIHI